MRVCSNKLFSSYERKNPHVFWQLPLLLFKIGTYIGVSVEDIDWIAVLPVQQAWMHRECVMIAPR